MTTLLPTPVDDRKDLAIRVMLQGYTFADIGEFWTCITLIVDVFKSLLEVVFFYLLHSPFFLLFSPYIQVSYKCIACRNRS